MDENLRAAPLFKALDDEAAFSLRQSMVPQTIRKGEILFQEGQPGDQLYLVKSGKIKAFNIYQIKKIFNDILFSNAIEEIKKIDGSCGVEALRNYNKNNGVV